MPKTDEQRRRIIIADIINTEEWYMTRLQEFHDLGLFCKNTLPENEFNYYFTPLIKIFRAQKPFLIALRQHIEDLEREAPRIMNEYFDEHIGGLYLVASEQYNPEVDRSLLDIQASNKRFDAKVREFYVKFEMNMNAESYRALPIGKMSRYCSLITDLAMRLPPDRCDEAKECADKLKAICENEVHKVWSKRQ